MEKQLFDKYLQNEKVVKLKSEEGCHMFNEKNNILVSFQYSFSGNIIPEADNRIYYFFEAYHYRNIPEIKDKVLIEDEVFILVNKEHLEHSILYKITIQNDCAILQLIELPEIGKNVITEDEKKGLKKYYKN